ncbi:MAG: ribosome biogenesis GTPase YlqF [Lachnospiraceae bacterium]|nr:ribosome biogenesis GTPase YlqF [Lachnospiraceae bacterium]
MNYQWYPGHMTKAMRMMQEDIKLIDLVIEIIDARIPISSRNPDIDKLAQNKSRMILMNKSDLADKSINEAWKKYFEEKGFVCLLIDSKKSMGFKDIKTAVGKACSEKIERDRKKGIINRPLRALVCGIPNVGKSTFINAYAKKACTKTGNKPGVTKGKQWIRLDKTLELLDTPGVLWPKFEDQKVGLHLAMTGSINDEILHSDELCYDLLKYMNDSYQGRIEERYGVEPSEDVIKQLECISVKRGCLVKGGEPDIDKAAKMIIEDFRSGKLGNISVERPEEYV